MTRVALGVQAVGEADGETRPFWRRGGPVRCNATSECALEPAGGCDNVMCVYFYALEGEEWLCSCPEGRSGPACRGVSPLGVMVFVSVLPVVARGLGIAAGALRTVWRPAPRATRVALALCTYALVWLGLAGLSVGAYFVGAMSSVAGLSVGVFAWLSFFLSFIVVRHVVIIMFYDVVGKATQTLLAWPSRIVVALTAVQLVSLAGTLAFGASDHRSTLPLRVALNTMRAGEVLGLAILARAASRLPVWRMLTRSWPRAKLRVWHCGGLRDLPAHAALDPALLPPHHAS